MTSSPVTPVDNENMASLIKWDDEEGEVQEEKKTRQMRMDQYKTRPIQLRYYNSLACKEESSYDVQKFK